MFTVSFFLFIWCLQLDTCFWLSCVIFCLSYIAVSMFMVGHVVATNGTLCHFLEFLRGVSNLTSNRVVKIITEYFINRPVPEYPSTPFSPTCLYSEPLWFGKYQRWSLCVPWNMLNREPLEWSMSFSWLLQDSIPPLLCFKFSYAPPLFSFQRS